VHGSLEIKEYLVKANVGATTSLATLEASDRQRVMQISHDIAIANIYIYIANSL